MSATHIFDESCCSATEKESFPGALLLQHPDGRLTSANDDRRVEGQVVELLTPADQNRALSLVGCVEWVCLHFREDRQDDDDSSLFIPVENLIAATAADDWDAESLDGAFYGAEDEDELDDEEPEEPEEPSTPPATEDEDADADVMVE